MRGCFLNTHSAITTNNMKLGARCVAGGQAVPRGQLLPGPSPLAVQQRCQKHCRALHGPRSSYEGRGKV